MEVVEGLQQVARVDLDSFERDGVRVQWRSFEPHKLTVNEKTGKEIRHKFSGTETITPDPNRAVLFFPGWPMEADKESAKDLPQAYANELGGMAYAIDTTSNKYQPDFSKEVEVAADLIKDLKALGLNEVTLVGHSQGALKAAHLAVYLQNHPELGVQINLVVVVDPMGMFKQGPVRKLAVGMGGDILAAGKLEVKNEAAKMAGADVSNSIKSKLRYGKFNAIRNFWRELKEMAAKDPIWSQINQKIVVVAPGGDRIADPARIAPIDAKTVRPNPIDPNLEKMWWGEVPADSAERDKYFKERTRMTNIEETGIYEARRGQINETRANMAANTRDRVAYLGDNTLTFTPENPKDKKLDITVIVPTATVRREGLASREEDNAALHNSMPVKDYEQVAATTLYMGRRKDRKNPNVSSSQE